MAMGACPGQIPMPCVPPALMVTATMVRACRYTISIRVSIVFHPTLTLKFYQLSPRVSLCNVGSVASCSHCWSMGLKLKEMQSWFLLHSTSHSPMVRTPSVGSPRLNCSKNGLASQMYPEYLVAIMSRGFFPVITSWK